MPVDTLTPELVNEKVDFKKPRRRKAVVIGPADGSIKPTPQPVPTIREDDLPVVQQGLPVVGEVRSSNKTDAPGRGVETEDDNEDGTVSEEDLSDTLTDLADSVAGSDDRDDTRDSGEAPSDEDVASVYRDIFAGALRETTKQLLLHSDDGKRLLHEVLSEMDPHTTILNWEKECLNQLRPVLQDYSGHLKLQVIITPQPVRLELELHK